MATFHDFQATTIDGQTISLDKYKGKVCLVVNVASRCGYTPQYQGLEALHRAYHDRGLAVLGFPSNDFGAQEPGTEADIKQFCTSRYGVTFDMFAKVPVTGSNKVDIYQFLTSSTGNQVQWNFNKFLVDKEGKVVKYYPSSVSPDSLKQDIEALL